MRSRPPGPPQFGILGLIAGVSLIAVLLAIRAYAWALVAILTAFIVIVTEIAATRFRDRPCGDRSTRETLRFQQRLMPSKSAWPALEPVVVAAAYITIFVVWHIWLYACINHDYLRPFFGLKNGMSVSLRALDHAVNVLVLAYLAAHLAGSVFPHASASRNDRIPIIVAMIVVTAMHLSIP